MNDEEGGSSYTAPSLAHSSSPRCVGHVVSQRARGLRLRRADFSLALSRTIVVPSSIRRESVSWFCVFRKSIARPTDTPVYASSDILRCLLQDSGPRWSRCLPSCRTLSFPTTCQFIPAHPD